MDLYERFKAGLSPGLKDLCDQWIRVQPLEPENEMQLWQRLRLEWNYNSNHIEGNTLSYGETMLLLIHGRTRGDHLLREYEEMRGHDVAIEHVRSLARDQRTLAEGDIRDLNRILLKEGYWQVAETASGGQTRRWIEPGRYKTAPNHVLTATGEMFYFASPEETPAMMQEFASWMAGEIESPGMGLVPLLVEIHRRFILIHPFDDGNGRVVRLLVNYVLLRAGLLPVIIKASRRKKYLDAIAASDTGDNQPLEQFLEDALIWSMQLGIRAEKEMVELESDE